MTTRYGKVETGFWNSQKVRRLSERAKFAMLYLLSCPHGNSVGCFVVHDGYISADLSWPSETVTETLSELFAKGLIERDEDTKLLRITGWWGHNSIENPNVAKHAAKEIASLPDCEVKQRLIASLLGEKTLHETVRQTLSERLPEPFRNQEPNPTQQEPNHNRRVAKAIPPNEKFDEFWKCYPKRKGDNPKAPARKAFEAAVKAGADPKTIIAGLKIGVECNRHKIGTEYIPQAVKWLRDKRWEQYAQADAASEPVKPEDIPWDQILDTFKRFGRWPSGYGGQPGMVSCQVPAEFLRKHGFEQHAPATNGEAATSEMSNGPH